MIAEIISIGSELTSGQNLDTNSQWLSRRLGEIGIPVSDAVISLRILARAATAAAAQAQIEPVERTIRERLGDWVFGAEAENLEDAVVRLLPDKRRTLATARS